MCQIENKLADDKQVISFLQWGAVVKPYALENEGRSILIAEEPSVNNDKKNVGK